MSFLRVVYPTEETLLCVSYLKLTMGFTREPIALTLSRKLRPEHPCNKEMQLLTISPSVTYGILKPHVLTTSI